LRIIELVGLKEYYADSQDKQGEMVTYAISSLWQAAIAHFEQ
jgi:hypothetical protein